jgi:hypothetical protein
MGVPAERLPAAAAVEFSAVLLEAEATVVTLEYVDTLRSIVGFERDKNDASHGES